MVKLSSNPNPEDNITTQPLASRYYHADGTECPKQSVCPRDYHTIEIGSSIQRSPTVASSATPSGRRDSSLPNTTVRPTTTYPATPNYVHITESRSSIEISENSKGEPIVAAKVYDDDVMRGVDTAYRAYRQARAYLAGEAELTDEATTTDRRRPRLS